MSGQWEERENFDGSKWWFNKQTKEKSTTKPLLTLQDAIERIKKLELDLQKPNRFTSDWVPANASKCNVLTFKHTFGSCPAHVTVHFTPSMPANDVYDITWCQNYCNHHGQNSAFISGSFKLTTTDIQIPVWSGGVFRYWDSKAWKTWKNGFIRVILDK
mmetsp:Transcript_29819/g.33256  ORF Transcript_29819/g.33256 Transcript_29819/m.33256 type:complete len:159 (+) Transcript_29819:25-501(+)